jgi:DNA polymerase-1
VNVQNIPRNDTIVKSAIIPKLDCLLLADYSQIEYRLFAKYLLDLVDDSWAVDQFKAGKDFHEETAKRMLEAIGRDYHDPLTDEERGVGKTGNFAAIFSGGIPTIQRQLGCSKGTARRLADAFHEQYPLLGRWEWKGNGFSDPPSHTLNGQLVATLRAQGFVRNLWGRHLHPEEDRKILNAVVQGGAADMMKQAMGVIDGFMTDRDMVSHMVNSVHDEVKLDCVEDEVPYLIENLPSWMDDATVSDTLPVEVDMKISYTNWGEAEKIE